jgi:hypothetical protein
MRTAKSGDKSMRGSAIAPDGGEALSAETIDNRHFVLILQHPQERREMLSTAAPAVAMLRRASLVVGLSWPNLSRPLDRPADPQRWAVLYLGSARPSAFRAAGEVVAVDRRGEPLADQAAALRNLDGVVLLDGSWSEAKTLWWRNPWLLKLRRIVLDPPRRSRYGRLRREPRREALSTLEAAGLVLKHLEGDPEIEARLLAALDRLLAAPRPQARVSS